jgi:hypothetical protein
VLSSSLPLEIIVHRDIATRTHGRNIPTLAALGNERTKQHQQQQQQQQLRQTMAVVLSRATMTTRTVGVSFLLMATAAALVPAAPAVVVAVPERMRITQQMKTTVWDKIELIPIDMTMATTPAIAGGDGATIQEGDSILADEAIGRNTATLGSIAFVIRRPG